MISQMNLARATSFVLAVAIVAVAVVWYEDHSRLTESVSNLSSQLTNTQGQLVDVEAQRDAAQRNAAHPTVTTWNVPVTIGVNEWSEGSVPDTFTFHLRYASDVYVIYAFLSLADYVRFVNCPPPLGRVWVRTPFPGACLFALGGRYAQPQPDPAWMGGGTSVSTDFHGAEGCADYVLVLYPVENQAARVTPNFSISYNPAPTTTGVCVS